MENEGRYQRQLQKSRPYQARRRHKDYNFNRETLVLLWIAEGFVLAKGRKHLEDVGSDYFDDLLLKSFFQRPKINSSVFVMHDLVHDLAQYMAGDMCFRLEEGNSQSILGRAGSEEGNPQSKLERARHASVLRDTLKSGVRFEALSTPRSLRTVVLLNGYEMSETLSMKVLHDLMPTLGCLRFESHSSGRSIRYGGESETFKVS